MWCNLAIESRLSCEHLAIFFFQILYLLPILDTLRSVNDVTEGITQESPMSASWPPG